MKLALRSVEVAHLRTDGGTQVRERLDEDWIVELSALIDEGGHDIPPILVMEDSAGVLWLVDGFHRVEAARRVHHSALRATVREGTVEMARFQAAMSNKNGLPRKDGDKKRAILMALDTVEGQRMKQEELARHVGCSQQFVSRVIPSTTPSGERFTLVSGPRKARDRLIHQRVDAELAEHPNDESTAVAARVGCTAHTVRERRKSLGMPPIPRGTTAAARGAEKRAIIACALKESPSDRNRSLATRLGVAPETVASVRAALGISNRPGPRPAEGSAPVRRSGDPRDGSDAKVIPARPKPTMNTRVVELLKLVEALGPEDHLELASALNGRWPKVFALPGQSHEEGIGT